MGFLLAPKLVTLNENGVGPMAVILRFSRALTLFVLQNFRIIFFVILLNLAALDVSCVKVVGNRSIGILSATKVVKF